MDLSSVWIFMAKGKGREGKRMERKSFPISICLYLLFIVFIRTMLRIIYQLSRTITSGLWSFYILLIFLFDRRIPMHLINMEDGGLFGGWALIVWFCQKQHFFIGSILICILIRCQHPSVTM